MENRIKICEILSVGTELLLGDVTDTNATFLSRALRELGFFVYCRQTVGDNEKRMKEAFSLALSRSDLVIVTGGLGPTYDDITKEVVASVFEMPLEENTAVAEKIRAYFQRRGMKMGENNLRQAQVPVGAEILNNDWGTAPGLWLKKDGKGMILLPGVPREMKNLFSFCVKPRLVAESEGVLCTQILHFYGISESLLDETLSDLMTSSKNPTVAPYAADGEVELHVTARGKCMEEAKTLCETAKEKILSAVGEFCYGEGETSPEREVVKAYREKKMSLATAESCTGGLLSQKITSVAGSSEMFALGVAAYSEEIKRKILGVSEKTLQTDGVYSILCALEMARGVRRLAESDVGVGITGIAGPSGGTDTDPVGTVYLAVVSEKEEYAERVVFGHGAAERDHIRHLAAKKALMMALSVCKKAEK